MFSLEFPRRILEKEWEGLDFSGKTWFWAPASLQFAPRKKTMQPERDYVQWDATPLTERVFPVVSLVSPVIIASSEQESPVWGDDLPVLREALEVRGVSSCFHLGTTMAEPAGGTELICKQSGSLSQGIGVIHGMLKQSSWNVEFLLTRVYSMTGPRKMLIPCDTTFFSSHSSHFSMFFL